MRILIVDDHDIVRKGLIAALELEKNFDVIEEAEDIESAMKKLRTEKPEIALIDLNLGNKQNGINIIKQAQKEGIQTKYMILTSSSQKADFADSKALGVSGYILKDSALEDIEYAIKAVMKGRNFFDSQIQVQGEKSQEEKMRELLTEREVEVLRALGLGLTNAQIAEKLYITENTVKKHISSLLAKLEFTHRTEAALYSARLWRREEDFLAK